MKQPIFLKTRKQLRNELRQKYGNKGMRKIWTEMQKKKYGENAYLEMRKATDPKRRHGSALLGRIS